MLDGKNYFCIIEFNCKFNNWWQVDSSEVKGLLLICEDDIWLAATCPNSLCHLHRKVLIFPAVDCPRAIDIISAYLA